MKNIAIIGTGISGLVCGYLLHRDYQVTLYEANDRVGGHTNTVDVETPGGPLSVDTGFIVFNDWTYPNFIKLLDELDVASQPSDMSFSVQSEATGLEYNGTSLNSLFAQRRNLLSPRFHGMIRDILRFNREAPALLETADPTLTIGEYLRDHRYGDWFRDNYIVPMGSAIWSAPVGSTLDIPALFFVRFFKNHGMLSVDDRPQWRTVKGGSQRYIDAMLPLFGDRIRVNTPVCAIRRQDDGVELRLEGDSAVFHDEIIFACHSDQALRLLADPSAAEKEILGALPYQPNEAVLHTDTSLMPDRRLAWAAWNYHLPATPGERVAVTYNMNILQNLPTEQQVMVTLNYSDHIDPDCIIKTFQYDHPLFTRDSLRAQQRHHEISGVRHTHYCGAYWRYGFHEDGVMSGLRVCQAFDAWLDPDFTWSDAQTPIAAPAANLPSRPLAGEQV